MADNKFLSTTSDTHRGWFSRGFLPHFDDGESYQFITIRLADSIPAHVLHISELYNKRNKYKLSEKYLDNHLGSLILSRDDIAKIVFDAIDFANGIKFEVVRWVIMPNHVHLLIRPINNCPIHKSIGSLKSFSAREANKILGKKGDFWARDYFDRYIRNATHLKLCIDYIDQNPVKSNLVDEAMLWKWGSLGYKLDRRLTSRHSRK